MSEQKNEKHGDKPKGKTISRAEYLKVKNSVGKISVDVLWGKIWDLFKRLQLNF